MKTICTAIKAVGVFCTAVDACPTIKALAAVLKHEEELKKYIPVLDTTSKMSLSKKGSMFLTVILLPHTCWLIALRYLSLVQECYTS